MLNRRNFLAGLTLLPVTNRLTNLLFDDDRIDFKKGLKPVGRVLESPDWFVWGGSPIYGSDGTVHLFYTRWPAGRQMAGRMDGAEIAYAVAPTPESPFTHVETVLKPGGANQWDGAACHSPHIQRVGGLYCLFYAGNANGQLSTERIGLATAKSLKGPWQRMAAPLLGPGPGNQYTTSPSVVHHPNGEYWLYYETGTSTPDSSSPVSRTYGLATASAVKGPYQPVAKKLSVDFPGQGTGAKIADAFVWLQNGRFNLLARDEGIYSREGGVYADSHDGIHWFAPQKAYGPLSNYVTESPAPAQSGQFGRLERPQLLMRHGKPTHLFAAAQGGKSMTASAFVFKLV